MYISNFEVQRFGPLTFVNTEVHQMEATLIGSNLTLQFKYVYFDFNIAVVSTFGMKLTLQL